VARFADETGTQALLIAGTYTPFLAQMDDPFSARVMVLLI
jgi:hypothetical protein